LGDAIARTTCLRLTTDLTGWAPPACCWLFPASRWEKPDSVRSSE
jgi:hypothetical protein